MVFNSVDFLLFFPIVVIIYYIVPAKIKYIWLLIASYYFYISCDIRFLAYLLPLTLLTYCMGVCVALQRGGGNKIWKYCSLPFNSNSSLYNISSVRHSKICGFFCDQY